MRFRRACLLTAAAMLLAHAQAARGDWPMLARDAARSGTTADEVRPPFARKWYRTFTDEGLMSGVQPVIAGGTLYLGTLRGNLHAIDTRTGENRWIHRAGAPILHAAAANERSVFFCAGNSIL